MYTDITLSAMLTRSLAVAGALAAVAVAAYVALTRWGGDGNGDGNSNSSTDGGSGASVQDEHRTAIVRTPRETEFAAAAAAVSRIRGSRLSADRKLRLYALFKQSTAGDAPADAPSSWDPIATAKL